MCMHVRNESNIDSEGSGVLPLSRLKYERVVTSFRNEPKIS